MQSSDPEQQPVNKTSEQGIGQTEIETQEQTEQQGFQPLYEFPPAGPLLAEPDQVEPAISTQPQEEPAPVAAAPSSGFVYPPPPSFYQNMPVSSQHPPFPPNGGWQPAPPAHNFRSTAQSPLLPANLPPGAPPPSALRPIQATATRKTNNWVWIVVTILSIALIGSCGLCGWGLYTIFASTVQQVSGSLDVVNDYYTNLQSKNYAAAYRDLAPQGQISGLTQDQFVKQATQLDQQYGPVVSFVLAQPHFRSDPNTGPDLSHFTITVDVKRTHSSYTALLTINKIGGNWKITEYDRI